MNPGLAELLLNDLARWTYGEALAKRALFHALAPGLLSAEVRAFRYGILVAALKLEALKDRALAEPLVDAPWDLLLEWAGLADGLEWGPPAEEALAAHFLRRMGKFGEPTVELRRFARGKAFKYGRRVVMLARNET